MINKDIIKAHMDAANCNYREAGESLGIEKQQVNYWMKKFDLDVIKKVVENKC